MTQLQPGTPVLLRIRDEKHLACAAGKESPDLLMNRCRYMTITGMNNILFQKRI